MGCAAPAGSGAIGLPCAINAECTTQYCATGAGTVCATCQPMPALGSSCADADCGQGQICLHSKLCGVPVADGGSCGADTDCDYGFACLTAAKGLKVCTPGEALGAPCDYTLKNGPLCQYREGLICKEVGDGGVCMVQGIADAGQACGDDVYNPAIDGGIYTICSQEGYCQKALPDAGTGTCLAAAAPGDACDNTNGPYCDVYSKCVITSGTAGTCQAQAASTCGVVSSSSSGSSSSSSSSSGSSSGSSGTTLNTIALVDNDGYVDPSLGDTSEVLQAYEGFLTGAGIASGTYDVITVANDGSQSSSPNAIPRPSSPSTTR